MAFSIRGPNAEEVKRTQGLTLKATLPTFTEWIVFTQQWDPKSPWHDRRVRVAATYAIDRKAIIDAVFIGQGEPWQGAPRKESPYYHERLAKQYRQAWTVYGGIGRRTVAREDASLTKVLDAVAWQVEHFADIPVIVIACLRGGRPPIGPLPPFGESSYYGSIYPSVQNLLLAARAMGLGAALITLPLWSTTVVRHLLGLPISVHPCCAVPLGWPRGRYGPTTRRPVGDVVHLDRYGNRPWQ